jgi:predicted site-specific integrase-resolvase
MAVKGYSLKEVAKKVGVSEATVILRIKTGKVKIKPKKNVQGHWVFTEAEFQKLKAHNESLR